MHNKQSLVRNVTALVLGFLVLTGANHEALALEKQTIAQGLSACLNWCSNHRAGVEQTKCKANCEIYWNCQGSDSTKKTCQDAILKADTRVQGQPGGGQTRQQFGTEAAEKPAQR
jgi:hypothetical protein